MGPSGCGKSTVGRQAAALAGAAFVEADDHHDAAARARMALGEPLTDDERSPWVRRVAAAANGADRETVVIACSALSGRVRRELDAGLRFPARFMLLDVPPAVLMRRLEERPGHFVGPALLASQLAALRVEGVERIDGTQPVGASARKVAARLVRPDG